MREKLLRNPIISIIIPVYNAENSIYKMIDCLEKQTFQDFEVILVNDGSKDDSLSVCERITRNKVNYLVFSQENQGAFAARNLGMEKAKGKYIAFLDADDKIEYDYFEVLLKSCHNSDIAVCDIAVQRNSVEIFRFTNKSEAITQTQALNKLLERQEINSGPYGKLFRREIVKNIRFPALRVYEDILFVLETFCKSKKIAITDETVYYYLQDEAGTMNSVHKKPALDIIMATEKLMEFIDSRKDLEAKCCYITISHLFQYALPLTINNDYQECEFIFETRKLYQKYMKQILKCNAVPWKEKIIFYLYAHGWVYADGQVKKIQRRG